MYEYKAKVLKIVDGDTVDLAVDVGFKIYTTHRFRLNGYNAPETRGPERAMGLIAKAYLEKVLPVGSVVTVYTYKSDSFGRYLCDIALIPGFKDLVPLLCREGYGVTWNGKGKRPAFDPNTEYPLKNH